MKKLLLLLATLAVLTACSAHTVVVADLDLLSFAQGTEGLEGDLTVPGSMQVYIPDADDNLATPDGGELISDLPALDELHGLGIDVVADVENTGSGPLDLQADFRLAPASDSSNIYDGAGDTSLTNTSLHLDAGASGRVHLEAHLQKGDPALDLVTSDGFRVGVEIQVSGSSTIHYQVTGFHVVLEQRPFDLIPEP